MNDLHPDYVVGEPIPRVELRVSEELISSTKKLNMMMRGLNGITLVLIVVLWYLGTDFLVNVTCLLALLLVYVGIGLLKLFMNRARLLKDYGTNDVTRWGIPRWVRVESVGHGLLFMMAAQALVMVSAGLNMTLSYLGIFSLMWGGWLVYYSIRARSASQISCDKCSYELVGLTLPSPCPECGVLIASTSQMTDFPRDRSMGIRVCGIVMVVLGFLFMMNMIRWSGMMYRAIPTRILLDASVHDGEAFETLLTRSLNDDEVNRLVDMLIDENLGPDAWGYDFYDQGKWIMGLLENGELSDDQLDRIMVPVVDWVWIDGQTRGKVGDELVFMIRGHDYQLPSFEMKPNIYVRGFEIDGDIQFQEREEKGESYYKLIERKLDSDDRFHRKVQFDMPGEYRVRVRVVLGLFTRSTSWSAQEIIWDSEGEYVFKTEPVWFGEFDLEQVVIIEE